MDNQPYDLAAMAEADIQTIRGEDLTDAGGIFLDPAIPQSSAPGTSCRRQAIPIASAWTIWA